MSKKIVLDASALLALLNQEPGYKEVETILPLAIMSSVNVSEVITVLIDVGIELDQAEELITELISEIFPFNLNQAVRAASLRKKSKQYGLSFGDRACLALAETHMSRVLTADKIWGKLKLDSVQIQVIR